MSQADKGLIRPKEKCALFPVTCLKFLESVGRQIFFFYKKTFLYRKSMKIFKNWLKIVCDIPKKIE